MKKALHKIWAHISRGWDEEPGYTHPRLRIAPPFFYELLAYLIATALLYKLGEYLWSLL